MNKLNKTFSNNTPLYADDLNPIVSKVNEVVEATNKNSVITMPRPVYNYLKTGNLLKSGTIAVYDSDTMTTAQIQSWVSANYQ